MTTTIAVIPLDDRSVNYDCIAMLGEAAALHVLLPPKAWLGTPWRAGQTDPMSDWLRQNAVHADALVVAVDTLGYGGLVNSRRSADPLDTVMARLEVLRQIKQAQPRVPWPRRPASCSCAWSKTTCTWHASAPRSW
jgi:hypothetical protein